MRDYVILKDGKYQGKEDNYLKIYALYVQDNLVSISYQLRVQNDERKQEIILERFEKYSNLVDEKLY